MKASLALLFTLLFVAALASGGQALGRHITFDLNALNDSGQSGKATISKTSDGQLAVSIALNGEPAGASEPAHIHPGSCANLDPVPKVVLHDVVDGKSDTTIPAPTSSPGARAIVVHKGSGADMKVYVACGDIPMPH